MMLGASREGIGTRLGSWEQMRIEQAADGTVAFFASPGGAPAVRFDARTATESAVEFINPSNDYPQRIRYERKGGEVEAEISLLDGSKPMRWHFKREGN
jgi:hypothetical protein